MTLKKLTKLFLLFTVVSSVALSSCTDIPQDDTQPVVVSSRPHKTKYSYLYTAKNGYLYTKAPSRNDNDALLWYVLLSNRNTPVVASTYYSTPTAYPSTYWRPASSAPTAIQRDASNEIEVGPRGPSQSFKTADEVKEEVTQGEAEEVTETEPATTISQAEINQENWQEEGPEGWQAQQDAKTDNIEPEEETQAEGETEATESTESSDTSSSDSGSSDSGSSDSGGGGDSGGGE